MEHLLFQPDATFAAEVTRAYHSEVLDYDWQSTASITPLQQPATRWYGFKHDNMPLCSLLEYASSANIDTTALWNAKFNNVLPSVEKAKARTPLQYCHKIAAFVQSWFYFGLLENFLQKKVNVSYLTRADDNGKVCLYSRNLYFCLQSRVFAIRLASDAQKQEISRKIQQDLGFVHDWHRRFMAWAVGKFRTKVENVLPGFVDLLVGTLPAIAKLAEVLERARSHSVPNLPILAPLTWNSPSQEKQWQHQTLSKLGYCAFQIKLLLDTVNRSTIAWICVEELKQNSAGHVGCTEDACARNNIDESTYEQPHLSSCD